MLRLKDRLRAFMERYRLSRDQMAAILRTPESTLDGWLDQDSSCLLARLNGRA